MFCRYCGKELPDNAVVCTGCGCLANEDLIAPQTEAQLQKNGMAVAGFVCSFLMPVLGWVFGGIGLSRSKRRNGKGKSLSVAAIVIASVNFVLALGMM